VTITRVSTAGPVTDPAASLSDSVTLAGDAFILLCVTARGGSGSPGAIALGTGGAQCTLANGKITTAGGLFSVSGSARFGRIYKIARADNPGAGAQTITVTWAGQDHIGVSLVEYRADGTLSITASVEANNASTPITLTLTALTGDVTFACCLGNSASPAFTPTSGQTELLESAWFLNSGHVVGELFGASSSIAWTASGSTCGGAVVLHEESAGETEIPTDTAFENDTAHALSALKFVPVGRASETDTAPARTAQKRGAVGLASEVVAAIARGVLRLVGTDTAGESDTAADGAGVKLASTGLAGELDRAYSTADTDIEIPADTAFETDTAHAPSLVRLVPVGRASETDTASTRPAQKRGEVGLASEVMSALARGVLRLVGVGLASETDTVGTRPAMKRRAVGRAGEVARAYSLADVAVFAPGPASRTRTPGPGVSRLHVPARGPNRVHVAAAGRPRTRLV
jgi:hypothetical protein